MNERELRQAIIDMLLPLMSNESSRKGLVESALWGCNVLHHITWSGNAQAFTEHLVGVLFWHEECEPGQHSLVLLLTEARGRRGVNLHKNYDNLIEHVKLMAKNPSNEGDNEMDNPELISFLVTTGIWARNELGQRWKLRRQKETAKASIPLDDRETMEAEGADELQASGFGESQMEQMQEYIDLKKQNIADWQLEIEQLDYLVNRGQFNPIQAKRQQQDLERKIQKSIADFPKGISRFNLNIEVEKLN